MHAFFFFYYFTKQSEGPYASLRIGLNMNSTEYLYAEVSHNHRDIKCYQIEWH